MTPNFPLRWTIERLFIQLTTTVFDRFRTVDKQMYLSHSSSITKIVRIVTDDPLKRIMNLLIESRNNSLVLDDVRLKV